MYCGKGSEQGELLEGRPFKPYHFDRTKSFPKVLSAQRHRATRSMRTKQVVPYPCNRKFGINWKWPLGDFWDMEPGFWMRVSSALVQRNPRVRKIRVCNSGPGNGSPNFMDTWKKCVLSAGKPVSIKFLVLAGGGYFGFWGGGGGVPILFLWARGFFWLVD